MTTHFYKLAYLNLKIKHSYTIDSFSNVVCVATLFSRSH